MATINGKPFAPGQRVYWARPSEDFKPGEVRITDVPTYPTTNSYVDIVTEAGHKALAIYHELEPLAAI